MFVSMFFFLQCYFVLFNLQCLLVPEKHFTKYALLFKFLFRVYLNMRAPKGEKVALLLIIQVSGIKKVTLPERGGNTDEYSK